MSVFNTFKFAGGTSSEKYVDVLNKFSEYCAPRRNIVFERYEFFSCSQQEQRSINTYLIQLRTLAATCEFADQEKSLVHDIIFLGIRDKSLQERLLKETSSTLKKSTEFIRTYEGSKAQLKTISEGRSLKMEIDFVKSKRQHTNNANSKHSVVNSTFD